jgi:hypothetical protein
LFAKSKPDIAVQILALSEAWAEKFPAPRDALFDKPYYERFLHTARTTLPAADFTSTWQTGSPLTLPAAIELAVQPLESMEV